MRTAPLLFLIVGAALLAAVECGQKLNLKRVSGAQARAHRAASKVGTAHAPAGFSHTRRGRFITDNYPADFFALEIEIGTPPKTFLLSVETAVNTVWAFDTDFPYLREDQTAYHPAQSNSSVDEEWFFQSQTGRATVYGEWYTDIVNIVIAELPITQSIGSVWHLVNYDPVDSFPVDGVFGVGWDPEEKDDNSTFASPVLKLFGDQPRVYSINLAPINSKRESFIGIGDFRSESADEIEYVAVPVQSVYSVPQSPRPFFQVDSIQTGSYSAEGPWWASADIGTGAIQVPDEQFYALYVLLGLEYDHVYSVFTIPAEAAADLSPLVINAGKAQLSIPVSEYTIDIGIEGKLAVPLDTGVWPSTNEVVLGLPVFHAYSVIFDIDNDEISFGAFN